MNGSASPEAANVASKFVSAERALAAIKPGSRIFLGTGCAAPRTLLATLEAMTPGPGRSRVRELRDDVGLPRAAAIRRPVTVTGRSSSAATCAASPPAGRLDYVPICLEEVPKLLATGRLPIDVALLQVSPPDARGFVSLGVSVDLAPAVLAVARQRRSPRSTRRCRGPTARASSMSTVSMHW